MLAILTSSLPVPREFRRDAVRNRLPLKQHSASGQALCPVAEASARLAGVTTVLRPCEGGREEVRDGSNTGRKMCGKAS